MPHDLESLLLQKAFAELSETERIWVLTQTTQAAYTTQRQLILEAKSQFASDSMKPRPDILADLQARAASTASRQPFGFISQMLNWLQRPMPLYQPLAACVLIFGLAYMLITPKVTEIEPFIVYVNPQADETYTLIPEESLDSLALRKVSALIEQKLRECGQLPTVDLIEEDAPIDRLYAENVVKDSQHIGRSWYEDSLLLEYLVEAN